MEVKVSFTLVLLSFSSASGCWSQMSSLLDCYVLCVCVRVCAGVRCDFSLKPSVCWFAVCRRSSPCWSGCRKTSKPSAPSSRSCTLPLLVSRSIAFLPSYLSDILGVCSSCVSAFPFTHSLVFVFFFRLFLCAAPTAARRARSSAKDSVALAVSSPCLLFFVSCSFVLVAAPLFSPLCRSLSAWCLVHSSCLLSPFPSLSLASLADRSAALHGRLRPA